MNHHNTPAEHDNAPPARNAASFLQQVNDNMPDWADTQIASWDTAAFRRAEDFVTHHYWTDRGSINVFRITGTDHPQYAGMRWRDLLHRGKRMDINIPLVEKNPGYYTDASQSHTGMSYVSLDGIHWYISADGNHRSCLARFYFHLQGYGVTQLHNVSLSHWQVDQAFMDACEAISAMVPALQRRGVFLSLTARRVPLFREDTPGWKLDTFSTEVTVTLDDTTADDGVQRFILHQAAEVASLRHQLEQRLSGPGAVRTTPSWWCRLSPFRKENAQ